ncbi:MAG: purine-nucleoside phosphorylase, partial [Candidatus Caldatribacteriaceae bacterium]
GADAVGMSTVPEVIVARHAGMRVFGISCITDLAIDGVVEPVSFEEIVNAAKEAEPRMTLIMKELVRRMSLP